MGVGVVGVEPRLQAWSLPVQSSEERAPQLKLSLSSASLLYCFCRQNRGPRQQVLIEHLLCSRLTNQIRALLPLICSTTKYGAPPGCPGDYEGPWENQLRQTGKEMHGSCQELWRGGELLWDRKLGSMRAGEVKAALLHTALSLLCFPPVFLCFPVGAWATLERGSSEAH